MLLPYLSANYTLSYKMSLTWVIVVLALTSWMATPIVKAQEEEGIRHAHQPLVQEDLEHLSRMQRKKTVESLLRTLFESKMHSKDPDADPRMNPTLSNRHAQPVFVSAPLAHPKAPISPSFHLLKVTGAQATLGSASKGKRIEPLDAAEMLSKKYEYVKTLQKEFNKNN
jgi:hypothetical protein